MRKEYIDKDKFYSFLGRLEKRIIEGRSKITDPMELMMWNGRLSEILTIKYATTDYPPDKIEETEE